MGQVVEGLAHDICTVPAPIPYTCEGDIGDGGGIIDDYPRLTEDVF